MIKHLTLILSLQDPNVLTAMLEMYKDTISCSAYYDAKEEAIRKEEGQNVDASIDALGNSRWHADEAAKIAVHLDIPSSIYEQGWKSERSRFFDITQRDSIHSISSRMEPMCQAIRASPYNAFINRLPKADREL